MSMTCKFKYNSSEIQLIFKSFLSLFSVFVWLNFLVFSLSKNFAEIIYNHANIFFSVPGVEKLEFYHLKLEYFYYAMDTLMININVSKKVF